MSKGSDPETIPIYRCYSFFPLCLPMICSRRTHGLKDRCSSKTELCYRATDPCKNADIFWLPPNILSSYFKPFFSNIIPSVHIAVIVNFCLVACHFSCRGFNCTAAPNIVFNCKYKKSPCGYYTARAIYIKGSYRLFADSSEPPPIFGISHGNPCYILCKMLKEVIFL